MERISKSLYKEIGEFLTDQIINSVSITDNKINTDLYAFYLENLQNEYPDVDKEILINIITTFKYTKRNDWSTQRRLFKTYKNLYTRLKTILEIQKVLRTNPTSTIQDIMIYLVNYMSCREINHKVEFKYRLYTSKSFLYKYSKLSNNNIRYYMDVLQLIFNNIIDIKKDDDDFKDVILYYNKLMSELNVVIPNLLRTNVLTLSERKERTDSSKEELFYYFKAGWKNKEIQKETNINYNTINKWRTKYNKLHKSSLTLQQALKTKEDFLLFINNKNIDDEFKEKLEAAFDIYKSNNKQLSLLSLNSIICFFEDVEKQ